MHLRAGTSGYSFKEWKGSFYPADIKAADMLSAYAARLPVVEINNTFYRMPKRAVIESWAAQVPDDFRFVVKASRRITHFKKLRDVGDELGFLLGNLEALGDKLGLVLFQLPPNMKRDDERLDAFLELLPEGTRAALEVRSASWLDEEIYARLRARGIALVAADVDKGLAVPLVPTAPFAYLRVRRELYDDAALQDWLAQLAGFDEAWVFFKHEDDGVGAGFARRMAELAGGS
jgi:uncharacterized protein YecE (DUF72 family)